MSVQTDEYSEDYTDSPDETEENRSGAKNWRRKLEDDAKTAREEAVRLAAENEALKRNQTFSNVQGLDQSNAQHKFFIDNYKGDLTEEAIAATAQELGFISPQQSQTTVPQEELSTIARLDRTSLNAQPVSPMGDAESQLTALSQYKIEDDPTKFWAAANALGLTSQE